MYNNDYICNHKNSVMAQETIGQNITFDIYNADGTSFNGLVLHKSTWESVVMSLGDKITGDVYYPTNALVVTMQEYIVYKGVKYSLVNPPTIVREGMASDNSELKGMTKYSFTFYHPMYMLANFPFSDVAVSSDQQRYLSENKTFYWIGNLVDYVAKLNKNLQGTEWCVEIGITVPSEEQTKLSEVLSFDKQTIADALKTGYETWEVPYVIDTIDSTDSRYAQGKRFLVHFGLPSEEILVENEQHELVPYVFRFGQGVGLKNNSRTPRNNKIVTRISGYGSENNIPYGYPQILWTGNQSWDFTINNDSDDPHSYPIYDGIMNGQPVRLIKHPFTRSTLMPSIYSDTVNRKVNPYATGYDPTIELKDYYDADNTYENPINPLSPSYEIHEFEKIKPELGDKYLLNVEPYEGNPNDSIALNAFLKLVDDFYTESDNEEEKEQLNAFRTAFVTTSSSSASGESDTYTYQWSFTLDGAYKNARYTSSGVNFEYTVLVGIPQTPDWDDSMDGDGNYKQSYFKITIPQLDFDLYACAAVTQEMTINMRSGACLGCSFPVAVDWEDYKANFYDEDGDFAPEGSQRDLDKYPDSSQGSISLIVQKDINTFGTLMPNRYQKPARNDKFVILGISLPYTYVTAAESRLDVDMKQYMRDNNVYYFDYPLKFDEHFLATHTGILEQMKPNIVVRFEYAGTVHALYIKQMSVKFWQSPLPQYDITLTDDVEIVLNPIGRVTDEVSNLRLLLGQGGGIGDVTNLDQRYLSKIKDDKANGLITLIKGLQVGARFVSGLLGEGGIFRKESDGTTYLETDKLYVRMRAYFDTVEVKRYLHSGGNRIASKAGIKCTRVEYIDEDGYVTNDADEAVKFRCYFRANDNGVTITNDFEVNDLAFCRETNVDTTSVDLHSYWRKVVSVGNVVSNDGELYIDLSATDCQSGSDIPIAQDDIIQLGNTTDTTRQGAIVEFVGGADAPSYQIFQNINTYSLEGKNYISLGYNSGTGRAYLNVYGDTFIGAMPDEYGNSPTYIKYNACTRSLEIKARINAQSTIDGETLAEFIAQNTWTEEQIDALITAGTEPLEDAIEEIQRQVDGSIATWFYDGVPTLSNLPASGWTTADLKNEHLGDLYYDNLTGYAYRFKYDDTNHQWSWGRITDVDVTKALADAAKAQDTADHKRRIFVVQPTPPYDQGDLWVNATYPSGNTETNAAQNKYYNDVLRCNTTKASGTSFAIADWGLASKYTDDQALEDFKANQYVQQLTNGTLNQGISNAQSAASQAALDAAAAQAAADNAQTDADAANDRLDDWADDGVISPTEKTSLNVDWEDMKKEYVQICNDADKYNVSKTAFTSAYTSANAAFQKYTASTPENITIGSDYANIAAYYAARQTIMDAISVAAKKVATDAQAAADAAGNTASSALTAAQAAEAHAATMDAVKQALNQGTLIDGGLVLSTFIGLRDANNTLWSGISGAYSTTGAYGGGLAAWFGGGHVDRRNSDGTWNNVGAKVGFRFDGSGYVAGGAISWDATGLTKVTASKISALEIDLNGDEVATESWVSDNFVSITFFERLFKAYNGSTIVHPNSTSTIDNIKAMFGFWTEQYISALGQGSGGGSGVGDVTWDLLASSSDARPIALSHLTGALYGYATQSWVNSRIVGMSTSLAGLSDVDVSGVTSGQFLMFNGQGWIDSNAATKVKVNGSTYNVDSNGLVDLGTISGSTGSFLPLSGGTLSNAAWASQLNICRTNDGGDAVIKYSSDVRTYGYIGVNSSFQPIFYDNTASGNGYKIWNESNDGSGSGLDADTVDGLHANSFYSALETRAANTVMAAPNGSNGTARFRALVAADIPQLSYLPLSGGTLSSGSERTTLSLTNTNTYGPEIRFYMGNTLSGRITCGQNLIALTTSNGREISVSENGLEYSPNSGTTKYKIWSSYNHGSGSGLDADTLDGLDSNSFYQVITRNANTVLAAPNGSNGYASFRRLVAADIPSLNYLPLSGGTLSNASFGEQLAIERAQTSNYDAVIKFKSTSTVYGYFGMNSSLQLIFYRGTDTSGTGYKVWNEYNDGSGSGLDADKLDGKHDGEITAYKLASPNNSPITYKNTGGTALGVFVLDSDNDLCIGQDTALQGYNVLISGNVVRLMYGTSRTEGLRVHSNGYIGINNTSPSYRLHVSGDIYATGAVTCLSDIREKNILGQTRITVEQIANMPSIVYRWKDNGNDNDEHVGSIAQDWQKTLPQVVLTAKDEKKTLSMQYGVAALVSAIAIARKVVDHERRIKELENENRKLKEQ